MSRCWISKLGLDLITYISGHKCPSYSVNLANQCETRAGCTAGRTVEYGPLI